MAKDNPDIANLLNTEKVANPYENAYKVSSPRQDAIAIGNEYRESVLEQNKWDLMNDKSQSMIDNNVVDDEVIEQDGRKIGTTHGQKETTDWGLEIYWDKRTDKWVSADDWVNTSNDLYEAQGGKDGFLERNPQYVKDEEEIKVSGVSNYQELDDEVITTENGDEDDSVFIDDSASNFGSNTEFDYEYKALPTADRELYMAEASEITDAMVELAEKSADLEKQGIDDIKSQRKLEFDFLNKKQQIALLQMQSKQNLPQAMRGQQFNQLMLNQFVEMSNVYTELDLQKLGVDSELAQYKMAIQEKNYELANQMYDQALQRASITYDITGEYIPPELDYMYSQLDTAEKALSNSEVGSPEYEKAQNIFDTISKKVEALGFNANERHGYQARKDAYSEYINEFELYAQRIPLMYQQYEMASQSDTMNALNELRNNGAWEGGMDVTKIYEIFAKYPYADVSALWGGEINWEAYGLESPTTESVTMALRDIILKTSE